MNLGKLIPGSIVFTLVLNAALRLVPPETYAYRAWEPMVLGRSVLGGFRRNARFQNPTTHGDLANLGNLPEFRQLRQEIFTTDECGNRNPPDIFSRQLFTTILAGRSFMVGSGIDDSLTPSELLRQQGIAAYNAAGAGYDHSEWLVALAKRLGIKRGFVVWDYVERFDTDPEDPSGPAWAARAQAQDPCSPTSPPMRERLAALLRPYWRASPLQIFVRNVIKKLQNDVFFPNPYQASVQVEQIANGDRMLFLTSGARLTLAHRPEEIARATRKFESFSRKLSARGLTLIVMLVPDKYRLYAPLLRTPPAPVPVEPSHLAVLQAALESHGVQTLNLEPGFKDLARRELAQGRTIYWKDDTHWNEIGIRAAAAWLATKIEGLLKNAPLPTKL